ncbi:MAG: EamA family transporter [Paludibacteraceae bacterium]|nr:EamA family transporter [Paludibacteraceae bacterium]
MWLYLAILSAVFAAATAILAKIGIENVNSNLATAIRTVVVLLMAWGMVFVTNSAGDIASISPRSWLFLILSGIATGASWLCYFYALKHGDASKVVPIDKCSLILTIIFAVIFLGEPLTWKTVLGAALLLAGTLVMVL